MDLTIQESYSLLETLIRRFNVKVTFPTNQSIITEPIVQAILPPKRDLIVRTKSGILLSIKTNFRYIETVDVRNISLRLISEVHGNIVTWNVLSMGDVSLQDKVQYLVTYKYHKNQSNINGSIMMETHGWGIMGYVISSKVHQNNQEDEIEILYMKDDGTVYSRSFTKTELDNSIVFISPIQSK